MGWDEKHLLLDAEEDALDVEVHYTVPAFVGVFFEWCAPYVADDGYQYTDEMYR